MTVMSASRLAKSFGGNVLFENVAFVISGGDRVGLIGPNGTGKTTLFRILCGDDEEYDGELSRRRGLRIARLEQSPRFKPGSTPRSIMTDAVEDWQKLDQDIARLAESLSEMSGKDQQTALARLADLEAVRDAGSGESALRRAETMLRGVGVRLDQFDQPMDTLSGGERCRVALARLLMEEPDLWLLDEPTNHLDLDGIAFLERFLRKSPAAAVIVSHDRRFLDQTVTDIWELEHGSLIAYTGNYSQSRRLREERRQHEWSEFMQQREFMRREETFINKWRAGTRSRQAQSRLKRLSKVELLDEPMNQSRLARLNLQVSRRLGDKVLEMEELELGYPGKSLVKELTLSLRPGEIVGVVGPNGAGKTTFFNTLTYANDPLSGTFSWGPTAEIGILGQHEIFENEERTPLEYLQDASLGDDDQDRRDKLGAMLFSGDEAFNPIRNLSGGEKKRLMLTRLLLEGHNVLLLDEPTNHLDIHSAEAVTLALASYPGTVLAISHDRYFLDEVADRVLWLEAGTWRMTVGGFAEAVAVREVKREEKVENGTREKSRQPEGKRRNGKDIDPDRPYGSWSVAKLESRIINNEARMADIHAAFADPDVVRDGNTMRSLQNELSEIETEQNALEDEYARRG